MSIDKILIVADDSPPSIKAIKYGFSLARDLGAQAVLLSVIEPASVIGNVDAGIFPDDALITARSKTEFFLDRMKNEYGSGIDVELVTSEGDIQSIVIEAAIHLKVNLIVTGTHNRTGLNKLLSGSVAESIIHHSPVPVCVVPMGK